ncbi:hypothetical protein KA111_02110 [Candidatus Woesebacteria bacterium]|nr:hypothetical protein [Candidatus Woesebacteria bacterium]
MAKIKKRWKEVLIIFSFCLLFFIPRYFASNLFDPMEDEFLSFMFSRDLGFGKLLLAPDYVHPGLWYALMRIPIIFFNTGIDIGLYRSIQVLIIFFCLVFSYIHFRKKLSNSFLFIFFTLFLSNIFIVHITIQYRMFSMMLGLAVIYSLFWFELIKNKGVLSYKKVLLLSVLAVVGFFTDYSMIWIIPFWPLVYLFCQKKLNLLSSHFKKIYLFFFTVFIGLIWFLPIFIQNIKQSLPDNNWLPPFNLKNILEIFGTSFGVIPLVDLSKLNFLIVPYTLILVYIIWKTFKKNINTNLRKMFVGIFLILIFFLISNYFVNNKLFYARAILSLIPVFYILLADFLTTFLKISPFKKIFVLLVLIQLSQFIIYFFQSDTVFEKYSYFNFQKHPMAFFSNFPFLYNSCLLPIPGWNSTSLEYFFESKINVISIESLNDQLSDTNKDCANIYLLDQISVERDQIDVKYDYKILTQLGYQPRKLSENYNQVLFILEKH